MGLVAPLTIKLNHWIESIGQSEWLCVTLRYLVSGDSQIFMSTSFHMSSACFGCIIKKTSGVLWDILAQIGCINWINNEGECKYFGLEFKQKWNSPHGRGD